MRYQSKQAITIKQSRSDPGHALQRSTSHITQVGEVPNIVYDVLREPGHALDAGTRAEMEPRFGQDFSGVRLHTDSHAAQSAAAVHARAYTVGRDVVFGTGEYAPGTRDGNRLLAHELTHVLQQHENQTALQGKLTVGAPDNGYEHEADSIAAGIEKDISHISSTGLTLQRQTSKKQTRLDGQETAANVEKYLQHIKRKLPRTAPVAGTGRIVANKLHYQGKLFHLVVNPPISPDVTLSAALGEGTFYLKPVPRDQQRLGVSILSRGAAFEIMTVTATGTLQSKGRYVVVQDLEESPKGILTYTTRTVHLAPVLVEARAPKNTLLIAQEVIAYMDESLPIWLNPGISAIFLIGKLESLNPEEMMEVLHHLQNAGRVGELLNLVSSPRFREFLRAKNVPWDYVFAHWESSLNDNLAVFAGVLVGAMENIASVIELIYILAGSLLSEELAKKRRLFFAALGQLVRHPIMTITSGLKQLRDTFVDKLWNLEFFDAGRIIGNAAVVILTLPAAIRALPQAAKALATVSFRLAVLTVRTLEKMGIRLRELVRAAMRPGEAFVTADGGFVLMSRADDVAILGGRGSQSGQVSRSTILHEAKRREAFEGFTQEEIDKMLSELPEDPGRLPPGERTVEPPLETAKTASGLALTIDSLENAVQDAINALRASLKSDWLPAKEFGTRLHSTLSDIIKQRFGSTAGLVIKSEEAISTFQHVPRRVLNMTIREFVETHLSEWTDELKSLFYRTEAGQRVDRLVGDLRPDLVIQTPSELIVWDLTARVGSAHLAKTSLYAHILGQEGKLVRIGETYWRHFPGKRPFDPKALYPAAYEAAAENKRKSKELIRESKGNTEP